MKKLYPYIFPAVALLFVLFLLLRWYNLRTAREGLTSLLNEEVTISELTAKNSQMLLGVSDFESADLTNEAGAVMGEVRYEVQADRLLFSVTANLPTLTSGQYQVWLRQVESEAQRQAFVLTEGKAGYMGSATINAGTLPLEVVVSRELTDDALPEEILLSGTMIEDAEEAE